MKVKNFREKETARIRAQNNRRVRRKLKPSATESEIHPSRRPEGLHALCISRLHRALPLEIASVLLRGILRKALRGRPAVTSGLI